MKSAKGQSPLTRGGIAKEEIARRSTRVRRRAWIRRFEAEQRERRQYCKLAWAVDEMARRLSSNGETLLDRDPQRLNRSLRDI
jgi:hypothetical protein